MELRVVKLNLDNFNHESRIWNKVSFYNDDNHRTSSEVMKMWSNRFENVLSFQIRYPKFQYIGSKFCKVLYFTLAKEIVA